VTLRGRTDAVAPLLEVLSHGSERAQAAALDGLAGHADEVRDPLRAWADEQVARASRLRRPAAALAAADPDSAAGYLAAVLARREAAIEGRLLTALVILGAPEAGGLIRRCLHTPDAEVRAQAIEALDALGDTRLARGVIRLLERDGVAATPADVMATANILEDDPDPWVRALAMRTLWEYLRAGRRALAERVRDDPYDLVRAVAAVDEGADEMPEHMQLVNDIDRMLALRRVPLFEALDPEDLQRVAAAAHEQSWTEGEPLMIEGELGDELVVIVEGSVSVVHRDDTGEREVRTYGEGDHIGELAVLREAPRAATVLAAGGGVRGLVIDGAAVGSLLRERPEAAAAMLATLAERISQQA
jgi:HEAT repeat protein